MDASACEERKWPFVAEAEDAEEEVDDLECGDWFYGAVKILGEEVPEDLGPEKGFYCGGYLVCVLFS